MKTAILIPARLESTRYPNKMLVELDGKPLIQRVYEACKETVYDTYVVTAVSYTHLTLPTIHLV